MINNKLINQIQKLKEAFNLENTYLLLIKLWLDNLIFTIFRLIKIKKLKFKYEEQDGSLIN